jgi:hypothetical protein
LPFQIAAPVPLRVRFEAHERHCAGFHPADQGGRPYPYGLI